MNRPVLVFAIGFASCAYGQVQIQPLQEKDVDFGCGCSFRLPGATPELSNIILMWEEGGPAKMRINGRLETLTVSKPKIYYKLEDFEKVGDRTVYKLTSSRWSATVDCQATKVCSRDDDSCESTSYMATLFLTSPKAKESFKLQGSCGC